MIIKDVRIKIIPGVLGLFSMYIIKRDNEKKYVAKPIKLEFEELKDNDIYPKPSLVIPDSFADELMEDLAKQLDENNIKTDSNAKMEGILKATKYHLSDLRELLKLKE